MTLCRGRLAERGHRVRFERHVLGVSGDRDRCLAVVRHLPRHRRLTGRRITLGVRRIHNRRRSRLRRFDRRRRRRRRCRSPRAVVAGSRWSAAPRSSALGTVGGARSSAPRSARPVGCRGGCQRRRRRRSTGRVAAKANSTHRRCDQREPDTSKKRRRRSVMLSPAVTGIPPAGRNAATVADSPGTAFTRRADVSQAARDARSCR